MNAYIWVGPGSNSINVVIMYCLVRVIVIIAIISIVVIFIIILLEWAWQDEPIVKLNQSAPPRYFPLSISIPPLTPGHLQITWITLELFFSLPWNFFISLSPFFQRSGLRSLEIFELIMFLCHRHFQPTCSNFATFRKDKIENNSFHEDNYYSNDDSLLVSMRCVSFGLTGQIFA